MFIQGDSDARSWNWSTVPITPKSKFNWKKFAHNFVMAVLVGAVLGLLYVNWYEAQIIARQRHLLIEMWYFIQNNCASPTSYTRF